MDHPKRKSDMHYVVKSNALIEGAQRLSLREQRLLLLLLSKVDSTTKIDQSTWYTATPQELGETFPAISRARNTVADLRAATQGLYGRTIDWKRGDKRYSSRWISAKRWKEDGSEYSVQFAQEIWKEISFVRKGFTKIAMSDLSSLKSKYGVRLFEVMTKWKAVGRVEYSEEQLRQLLGAETIHTGRGKFKERVLEAAVRDIKEHTTMLVEMQTIKQGSRNVGYAFKIRRGGQVKN